MVGVSCSAMARHRRGCDMCKSSPAILEVPIPAGKASGDVALAFVVGLEETSF